jgi:fucose permease
MFVQALVINLTPLFFIPLQHQFGLSFEQLGRLVLINFLTQMLVDLVCTVIVDRFGLVRLLSIIAHLFAAAGLWLFATADVLFPADPYMGLVLGTMVFSLGCGLLEVLVSPIIQGLPAPSKETQMAFLHAFYPIGKVVVISISGLVLWLAGPVSWKWIAVAWSVVPLINVVAFGRVKLPDLPCATTRQRTRDMARSRTFWLGLAAIFLAGSAEVTLAQWTSAFAQAALGLPQNIADLAGLGLFGVMMIIGRLWFGIFGESVGLRPLLIWGSAFTTLAYGIAALCPWPWISLAACALAGLSVSMLWPGIVSLCAAAFPRAGISVFALLAAFGDSGAGSGPWVVGAAADALAPTLTAEPPTGLLGLLLQLFPAGLIDSASIGLRAGFLLAALAPTFLIGVLLLLPIRRKSEELDNH